ncbi:MAG: hypothetical protein GDA49_08370 [Rhodospirillales bacterium]|nr:hypothetical protein [Rhodospirillales bacterium]
MTDQMLEACTMATLLLGTDDPFGIDDDDLVRIHEELLAQRDIELFHGTDPAVLSQAMAAGEIVAGIRSRFVDNLLRAEGTDVGVARPREGPWSGMS